MEDESGFFSDRPLTDEEQELAINAINQKSAAAPLDPCQVCGSTAVTLGEGLTGIRTGLSIDKQPTVYPAVTTVCRNCGFIRHFHAGVLGINFGPEDKDA